MNYLQQASAIIQMSLNGYTTPQLVIDRINNMDKRQYKEQNYTSNNKSMQTLSISEKGKRSGKTSYCTRSRCAFYFNTTNTILI